jgi:uncharacterized protein
MNAASRQVISWTILLVLGVAFVHPQLAHADKSILPLPVRVETLNSIKTGEIREFWVSLPDQYTESSESYPVIYMLDGEFNFNSGVIGGLRYAAQMGEIPEFIVVGIKNTDRSRDVFPTEITYPDGSKAGGRADRFLDFIHAELIPYVDKHYRTESFRALYGTSNSGFTAVYALLRDPELANFYIAASATLQLPFFLAERDQLIRDVKGGKRRLALVMGEYDLPTVLRQNGELKEACDSLAPADLTCRFAVIRNGGHVPAEALLEGLRCLFEGWKITQPLTGKTFAEIRAQADRRLQEYGLRGRLAEESLRELGEGLLGEKKFVQAVEVLRYRVDNYPESPNARADLGNAYLRNGEPIKARELSPGNAAAASGLKELDKK